MKKDETTKVMWGALIGLVLAFWLHGRFGKIPDWDLYFQFKGGWMTVLIKHRSIITHSALPIFIIAIFSRALLERLGSLIFTFPAVLAFTGHFWSDMFPKAWRGLAFIHIPIIGTMTWIPFDGNLVPIIFSFCWLGLNILLSWFCLIICISDDQHSLFQK